SVIRILLSFFLLIPPPPRSTLFPYTTLFRSTDEVQRTHILAGLERKRLITGSSHRLALRIRRGPRRSPAAEEANRPQFHRVMVQDRKSTRLNSSHVAISYAVFCLKKKRRRHF